MQSLNPSPAEVLGASLSDVANTPEPAAVLLLAFALLVVVCLKGLLKK